MSGVVRASVTGVRVNGDKEVSEVRLHKDQAPPLATLLAKLGVP